MSNNYDLNKPRTLRCTGAEMDYLKGVLAQLRAGKLDVSSNLTRNTPQAPENKPVERAGISVEQFLASRGLPPLEQPQSTETESDTEDTTVWQLDPIMRELDRGICYEIDSEGYPEEAERFSRRYPDLWQKAFHAKSNKQTALYNEIMFNEVWEIVKNGKF